MHRYKQRKGRQRIVALAAEILGSGFRRNGGQVAEIVVSTAIGDGFEVFRIATVGNADTFEAIEAKYHILPIECEIGGMYESTLFIETPVKPIICTRAEAIADLRAWFQRHGVHSIFAYNACFDRNHLPELRDFDWYDIMRLAAYKQYNPKIPAYADCCSTGRLKRGYGV